MCIPRKRRQHVLSTAPSFGECFYSLLFENQGRAIILSSMAAARTLGASFAEAVYLSGVFLVKVSASPPYSLTLVFLFMLQ